MFRFLLVAILSAILAFLSGCTRDPDLVPVEPVMVEPEPTYEKV